MPGCGVTVCCPFITCIHNTSSEPRAKGYCVCGELVEFNTVEAESEDTNYHYGKSFDALVCTNYDSKPEYKKTITEVRDSVF